MDEPPYDVEGDGEDQDFSTFDDLPEFADENNRALHRRLKEHEKALVVVETELSETKERIGTMEEHLKSVNTEQLHTQRLVDAKIKEIETEDHLKQLAERGKPSGEDTPWPSRPSRTPPLRAHHPRLPSPRVHHRASLALRIWRGVWRYSHLCCVCGWYAQSEGASTRSTRSWGRS